MRIFIKEIRDDFSEKIILDKRVLFPGGSDGKALPTMRETWVQSLGGEDLLQKEMATHYSILAWKIPWTEEPGRLKSTGLQELDMAQ